MAPAPTTQTDWISCMFNVQIAERSRIRTDWNGHGEVNVAQGSPAGKPGASSSWLGRSNVSGRIAKRASVLRLGDSRSGPRCYDPAMLSPGHLAGLAHRRLIYEG